MLLSVIIPVYNGERYLFEAVASVQRQAIDDMEIIVVNDGSTDRTEHLLQDFAGAPNFRVIHQANQGAAAARNFALELARGDMLAFLDADDLWPENKLHVQLPVLEAEAQVQIVMGKAQRLWLTQHSDDFVAFEPITPPWPELLLGCAVCRRSVFDRIGCFDPTLRVGEDTEWFLRARAAGVKTTTLQDVTLFYRRHQDSLTWGMDHHQTTIFSVLKRALQRRRESIADIDQGGLA